jgi:ribosomal protein S18 acetylase RimI-like enzyme
VGDIPHRIYETLRGRYPLGELVQIWEEGTNIAGIAINFLFDTSFHVFVSPSCRGTDNESTMLQAAYATTLRYLQASGWEDTPVNTDVFSCDDIRKALLTRLGFEEYRVWDEIAERSLSEPIPESRLPDGFTIRSATTEDYAQLAAVRNAAFGSDWTPELYRDEVMRKPGYWPEREIVAAAPDGKIAAFTVIRLDQVNRIGQFEPVGTHRDFHRQGLARALMLYALREMQRLGMETATVGHDATNVAARELYRSLGFWKKYETLGYRRFSRDQGAGVRDQES